MSEWRESLRLLGGILEWMFGVALGAAGVVAAVRYASGEATECASFNWATPWLLLGMSAVVRRTALA